MTEIKVEKVSENKGVLGFRVVVSEKDGKSKHTVTMARNFYEGINTKSTPEKVIEKSFYFLLEREPKEQILSEFDIMDIAKYFPEYESELVNF